MTATFFATPALFREWLEKHHKTETELVVGYLKVGSGKPSITWPQSVDEALCFGWIDGVRKSMDEERYCIRFTPRKSTSIWSDINCKKVEELRASGRMTPEGLKAFELRAGHRSGVYSHENEPVHLTPDYEARFGENRVAWDFFNRQTLSYKKVMAHWIMGAKQEKTRLSRLQKTIEASSQQKRML